MRILLAIAAFVGRIFREILPALIEEWRKPRKVRIHGNDPEVNADIENQIDASIERGGPVDLGNGFTDRVRRGFDEGQDDAAPQRGEPDR